MAGHPRWTRETEGQALGSAALESEQAREFLGLMEGDRTYPDWAFLMGYDFGRLSYVALRWSNVDLTEGVVSVVDFPPPRPAPRPVTREESSDAIRSMDIDTGLVRRVASPIAPSGKERLGCRRVRPH